MGTPELSQSKVKGMRFSSILQVPSSKDSRLLKMLSKSETKWATMSADQVKMVEKLRKALSKFFSTSLSIAKCHRAWYDVWSTHTALKV